MRSYVLLRIQPRKHLRTTCPSIYAKTFFIILHIVVSMSSDDQCYANRETSGVKCENHTSTPASPAGRFHGRRLLRQHSLNLILVMYAELRYRLSPHAISLFTSLGTLLIFSSLFSPRRTMTIFFLGIQIIYCPSIPRA